MFMLSCVFFVTCVVPALCQIMHSLSVCSDETTSAAPRSFRQNRPPARTLSLTLQKWDKTGAEMKTLATEAMAFNNYAKSL